MAGGGKYAEIKKRCLRTRTLYEDPDFPADVTSLFKYTPNLLDVKWKRPEDISRGRRPRFGDYGDRDYYDSSQGALGDCWFVSSVACVASSPQKNLLKRVIPRDQGFDSDEYCGAFHFYFWQFGKWVEVIVDDRLPTLWGKLVYGLNRWEPDEYWCPLLEKAYAKLKGNYNDIDGGRMFESLVDLTGGIGELMPLKTAATTEQLTNVLLQGTKMNSFIGGGIFNPDQASGSRESRMINGLYKGHAYSVVQVKQINTLEYGKATLLHVRNPWGKGEWNGAWSDRSMEFKALKSEDRKATIRTRDNGEFWISVEDFKDNFDELELCHLTPDATTEELAHDLDRNQWNMTEHFGKWVRGQTAGGPLTSFKSRGFWTNPQFQLHLDKETEPTSVVISLLEVSDLPTESISVGFVIFKSMTSNNPRRINRNNVYNFSYVADSGQFWPYRERTRQFTMEPGKYVIVPCTYRKGQESEFYMRVFSEQAVIAEPMDPEPNEEEEEEKEEERIPTRRTVPPTGMDDTSKEKAMGQFTKLTGSGGVTDANGLMKVFNSTFGKEMQFSLTTCRSLALYAKNQVELGMVNREQFEKIWKDLSTWRTAFRSLDKDKTGEMEANELNELFKILDFGQGSSAVVSSIMAKYGGKEKVVTEEDFLQSFMEVLNLLGLYKRLKAQKKVDMPLFEWVALVILT